jgi:signal peptidase I
MVQNGFPTGDRIHRPKHPIKRRKNLIVGLLSFFMSGLGHLYIGEARRGIALFFGEILLTFIFFTSRMALSVAGLFLFLAVFAIYRIFVIADSVIINRKKGAFRLKRYNRFIAYAGLVVLATILSSTIQLSGTRIEAFKIPSPSMVPTVIIGDQIMVDKWAYRKSSPGRGDLIVFRYPRDPEIEFIKRCVAVAGDTVVIRDKRLFINGRAVDEPYAYFSGGGVFFFGRDNFGPYLVPEGKLFVLGDNRDNSNDSRYWGPVDLRDVKGRVRIIYWSWDRENKRIRWERIGTRFR